MLVSTETIRSRTSHSAPVVARSSSASATSRMPLAAKWARSSSVVSFWRETADLRMAWNWVAERYGCLGVLLEQPFKDTSWATDPVRGWSPERATRLGASFVVALNQVVPELR